jgi:hypothetical protein
VDCGRVLIWVCYLTMLCFPCQENILEMAKCISKQSAEHAIDMSSESVKEWC